jgi:hypothetical protein
MKNPVNLIEAISVKTPLGFVKEVFSKDNFMLLTKGIDEHDINASIYDGLRLVQMMCYRIGTEFDQVRLRGRDFWASFGGDPEPELDVDPEVLAGGGLLAGGGRNRRPAPIPLEFNRINNLDMPQAVAEILNQERAMMAERMFINEFPVAPDAPNLGRNRAAKVRAGGAADRIARFEPIPVDDDVRDDF